MPPALQRRGLIVEELAQLPDFSEIFEVVITSSGRIFISVLQHIPECCRMCKELRQLESFSPAGWTAGK